MRQTPGVCGATTKCGLGVGSFHVWNWGYKCAFPRLTQGYDSDIFEQDGFQQVGPTRDVDQVLNRLGLDVVCDALQGFVKVLVQFLIGFALQATLQARWQLLPGGDTCLLQVSSRILTLSR